MKLTSVYTTHLNTKTECLQVEDWEKFAGHIEKNYSLVLYIIDEQTYQYHQDQLKNLTNKIVLTSNEGMKSFEGFVQLVNRIRPFELNRESIIIAIGGGALSDLAGFVSSVYLRGVSFGILPSTLLSLIDASIGGKNGINFDGTKNQLGTIYQPRFIGTYLPFLNSLGREDISSGFAEIIKYGISLDKNLYAFLHEISIDLFCQNSEIKSKIIDTCISIKSKIISSDPNEAGDRKILNFGHTFGHALESSYDLSHGEAVSLGMLMALKISERELGLEEAKFREVKDLLRKFELPVSFDFDPELVYSKLMSDKKRKLDHIEFILIPEIGQAVRRSISLEKIRSYLIQANKEQWI